MCPAKEEAHQLAKGRPCEPRRERRATTPTEDGTPEGPVTEAGEMEVEMLPGTGYGYI